MRNRRARALAFILAMPAMAGLLMSPASAIPAVFVHAEPANISWYDKAVNMRLSGSSARNVTAAQLTAFLTKSLSYDAYKVCHLQPIEADTYIGLEDATQREIDADLKGKKFSLEGSTPNGIKVLVQAVLFDDCKGDNRGAAYLISNAATGAIYKFEPQSRVRSGDESPAWIVYLEPSSGEDVFTYLQCSECDVRTGVFYDVSRKKFYEEYTGE